MIPMFRVTMLFLAFIFVVILVAYKFRKHDRAIFWGVAIFLIIGSLFLLGTGVLNLYEGDHVNMTTLMLVTLCILGGGILAIFAEKNEELKRKRIGASVQGVAESQELEGVVLTRKLDTPLAKDTFAKAIKEGLMEVNGSHFKWKSSKILLAYMCGRIYCNDSPVPDPGKEGKFMWNPGDDSSFPDIDLNALFQTKDIGQSRNNRKFCPLPNDFDIIDRFFE